MTVLELQLLQLFFKRDGRLWRCRWSLASEPGALVGRQGRMGVPQWYLGLQVCVIKTEAI